MTPFTISVATCADIPVTIIAANKINTNRFIRYGFLVFKAQKPYQIKRKYKKCPKTLRMSKKITIFAAFFEKQVMTKLSVNINKVATLRNARGGNMPDVQRFAVDCELFGAQGITVHPRPDERHIRKEDVYQLKSMVTTELNVEGNPTEEFLALVTDIRPTQVTLVPDDPSQLTSNHGWDTRRHLDFLKGVVNQLHASRIRVSIFVDPDPMMVDYALRTGADRVELYTGPYAEMFESDPKKAIEAYRPAAEKAHELGLGMNAGHDLNLKNLKPFIQAFPWTAEVSIGHAIVCDSLYLGIQETIQEYLAMLAK